MQSKKEKNDVRVKTGFYETTYIFTNKMAVVEYRNETIKIVNAKCHDITLVRMIWL